MDDLSPRPAARKTVVHVNGKFKHNGGTVVYIQQGQSLQGFLKSAGERLGIHGQRLFSSDGQELDDLMLIEDGDIMFLSSGDDYKPHHGPDADVDSHGEKARVDQIGGYSLAAYLGRGAFGKVFKGVHQLTGEPVAIKLISKQSMGNVADAERISTEIHCLETLQHNNVIKLYRVLNTDRAVALVFEYAGGGDLRAKVRDVKRLPEAEAARLFAEIMDGVIYCHRRHVVHHDLKLENILLDSSGTAKIADFGLSKVYRPGSTSHSTAGSLAYIAPEVLKNGAAAGPPRDAWSLGVILYAMVCGRLPFEHNSHNKLVRRICAGSYKYDSPVVASKACRDLIDALLTVDPESRATLPAVRLHPWIVRHRRVGTAPMLGPQLLYDDSDDLAVYRDVSTPTPPPAAAAAARSTPTGSDAASVTSARDDDSTTPRSGRSRPGSATPARRRGRKQLQLPPKRVDGGSSDEDPAASGPASPGTGSHTGASSSTRVRRLKAHHLLHSSVRLRKGGVWGDGFSQGGSGRLLPGGSPAAQEQALPASGGEEERSRVDQRRGSKGSDAGHNSGSEGEDGSMLSGDLYVGKPRRPRTLSRLSGSRGSLGSLPGMKRHGSFDASESSSTQNTEGAPLGDDNDLSGSLEPSHRSGSFRRRRIVRRLLPGSAQGLEAALGGVEGQQGSPPMHPRQPGGLALSLPSTPLSHALPQSAYSPGRLSGGLPSPGSRGLLTPPKVKGKVFHFPAANEAGAGPRHMSMGRSKSSMQLTIKQQQQPPQMLFKHSSAHTPFSSPPLSQRGTQSLHSTPRSTTSMPAPASGTGVFSGTPPASHTARSSGHLRTSVRLSGARLVLTTAIGTATVAQLRWRSVLMFVRCYVRWAGLLKVVRARAEAASSGQVGGMRRVQSVPGVIGRTLPTPSLAPQAAASQVDTSGSQQVQGGVADVKVEGGEAEAGGDEAGAQAAGGGEDAELEQRSSEPGSAASSSSTSPSHAQLLDALAAGGGVGSLLAAEVQLEDEAATAAASAPTSAASKRWRRAIVFVRAVVRFARGNVYSAGVSTPPGTPGSPDAEPAAPGSGGNKKRGKSGKHRTRRKSKHRRGSTAAKLRSKRGKGKSKGKRKAPAAAAAARDGAVHGASLHVHAAKAGSAPPALVMGKAGMGGRKVSAAGLSSPARGEQHAKARKASKAGKGLRIDPTAGGDDQGFMVSPSWSTRGKRSTRSSSGRVRAMRLSSPDIMRSDGGTKSFEAAQVGEGEAEDGGEGMLLFKQAEASSSTFPGSGAAFEARQ